MKKTVLITGASSGLGKTAAKYFAGNGWNVVATMRSPDREKDLASLNDVLVTRLDVQDRDSISAAIEAGIARFGKIDVLINNAGFGLFGVFETISREKVQEQFDVNVFGVMEVTRAILPHFRKTKGGLILNISSGAGIYTLPLISLYCATKFALEGFSESLAYELTSQNIVVKIIEWAGSSAPISASEAARKRPSIPRLQITTLCRRRECHLAGLRHAGPPRKMWPKSSSPPRPMERTNCVMWPPATSCHWRRPGVRRPNRNIWR